MTQTNPELDFFFFFFPNQIRIAGWKQMASLHPDVAKGGPAQQQQKQQSLLLLLVNKIINYIRFFSFSIGSRSRSKCPFRVVSRFLVVVPCCCRPKKRRRRKQIMSKLLLLLLDLIYFVSLSSIQPLSFILSSAYSACVCVCRLT